MRLRLIDIGTSKGIRLPKNLIRQYNLERDIKVEMLKEGLLIKSDTKARKGWSEIFKVNTKKDNLTKDWQNNKNKFDEEEWTW